MFDFNDLIYKGYFIMPYKQELVDEINMLVLFDVSNGQEGLKVHSSASDNSISATKRLFDKGLVSHKDGGYLTDLGVEAAGYAQSLLSILSAD